jgi:hypothetical protein
MMASDRLPVPVGRDQDRSGEPFANSFEGRFVRIDDDPDLASLSAEGLPRDIATVVVNTLAAIGPAGRLPWGGCRVTW